MRGVLRRNLVVKFPDLVIPGSPIMNQTCIVLQDRGAGSPRSFLNHQELLSRLRLEFPFSNVTVFSPGDDLFTYAKQHYKAQLLIGPHGAGISNMMFMAGTAAAIEVHPRDGKQNNCYRPVARVVGIRLKQLVSEEAASPWAPFMAPVGGIIQAARELLGLEVHGNAHGDTHGKMYGMTHRRSEGEQHAGSRMDAVEWGTLSPATGVQQLQPRGTSAAPG
jgi:hypothetical protein